MSVHTRYERLNTAQDDFKRFGDDDDDDDENEEIELGTDSRLRFDDTTTKADNDLDDLDDLYATAGGNVESGLPRSTHIAHLPGGSRFMQMAIGTLATILLYLTLSISLTFYQKALIHKLHFPLTIVCYHLVIKYLLSAVIRAIYKFRTGKSRVQLDWRVSLRKMAPTGIASGIDIGFSQWGLELVSVSLYTMAKSSAIVFILFFAILLGLEKKSISLVFIVGLIAAGLLMFTYKSTQFNAIGFVFILIASLSSGVRWSLAQLVMQKSKLGLHNPVDMIFHMQPWMLASLLPFGISIEGQKLYDVLRDLSDVPNEVIYMTIFSITFGAVIAFCMEVSEFLVLSQTSSLTLSIAGIFKDICQVTLAIVINGDKLSIINILGLVVLIGGIASHVIHKYSILAKQEAELEALNDDRQFSETSINSGLSGTAGGGGSGLGGNIGVGGNTGNTGLGINASSSKKHSAQTVPLLEQIDSDDDSMDDDEQNASDVIFDVLKRRDMPR